MIDLLMYYKLSFN